MSSIILGNQKHLTPTAISKEVKLHRIDDVHPKRIFNNPHNFCTR